MGLPAAALAVAIGGQLAGGIFKGKAARDQAQAISDAAEFNALRAEQQGLAEEARLRRLGRRRLSTRRVGIAKAGVQLEGSPLAVLAQDAAELELDALNARIGAQNTAILDRRRAHEARQSGRTAAGAALIAGLAGGAGTFLAKK